ncbi:TonB-dependent receptor plug domain-containing protein [Rhodosalinus sediminis]|uniref:TonB-dependent receptor plug domain-containing protein n=1 Tax=Rhodosalinus sediminis TaxID=1940533 RepID=UPI0023566733|nr:TonB-dependent receptor [Rhodosalinus sediminis]
MNRTIFVAGLATLAAQSAAGQEAFDLGTLVVSPSLSPVPEGEVASTLEVLTGDEIRGRDTGARDTLARLPGVSYSANGGLGARSTINIRGLDNKYIGVRLDGIDVSDPTSTQTSFNFGQLVGSGLSRIEVLKGSQSALYGSEAIGGVVNLQSWRPTRDGASGEALLEAGSFGTLKGSASAGFRSERGEVALTLGRTETDGISAKADNDEKDGFDQTRITLSGRFAATETLTFGANVLWRDSESEYDGSTPNETLTKEETGARVFAELVTDRVTHTLSFSEFVVDRQDSAGTAEFTLKAFDGKRRELVYKANAALGANANLDVGLSRTTEDVDVTDPQPSDEFEGDETTVAAFAELRWRPAEATNVSVALRREDSSEFGVKTTGRIGVAHRLREDLTLRAVAGTGYRAPSLFERYSRYADTTTTLKPETSESYEIGLEKALRNGGEVKATLFYTEIDDRIGYEGGGYNQVDGTTVTQGLEISGVYDVTDRVTLTGSYTYTDTEEEGETLARVPRHDLVLGASADLSDKWSATGEIRRVADIEASEFAPADNKVGDYTLVNLGVGYDVTDTAELYLRVENALDEDYETAGGYNMPGRAVFAGLRASF